MRRSHYPRRNGRSRRRLLVILLLAAFMAIMLLAAIGRGGPRREGEVTIRVSQGTSAAEIARMLKDEDVIESERDFMRKAEAAGAADSLKAGTYRFLRGEPLEDIINRLEQGLQAPEAVLTVPEGFTLAEISAELAAKTDITEDAYRTAADPAENTAPFSMPASADSLEGFLFPSTYDLGPDVTAAALVGRQLEAFRSETADLPWSNAEAHEITRFETLTVASMIEREARVPEERPLVAAVIYNRLAAGMKLEVDATVQYAIGYWKRELTQADLEIDSPYNTRLYPGLPPGPICNPGKESIRAALEPASVDYLFYVTTGDQEGHHFFTASYDEFLEAKERR